MTDLPEKFKSRMAEMLGPEAPAFFAQYQKPPSRGIRVNTLKLTAEEFEKICPFDIVPSGTLEEGFLLRGGAGNIGTDPRHAAGLFYGQEPSAMAVIGAAEVGPGMAVLDLCAAPGGKSGGIAARMRGEGLLVANDISPDRARVLRRNMERLGVCNAAVTCGRPETLCAALPDYFDRVIVDAPCSGEGMFRKDPEAIAQWSPEGAAACALRQRAILESARKALKPGGMLVYSTCTFSREENEDTVEKFAGDHPDMRIESLRRLYPHTCSGEGHFIARLRRDGAGGTAQKDMKLRPCNESGYARFAEETFSVLPRGTPYILGDGRVMLLRRPLPAGLGGVRILGAGVCAGEMRGGRFLPAYGLFMAEHGGKYRNAVELGWDSPELKAFLGGDAISADKGFRGYGPVTAGRWPLGFGRASGGVLKNHLPKGLRVYSGRP